MPKYTFICEGCSHSKQIYASSTIIESECTCGFKMRRQLPKLRGLKTTETVDKFTNQQHITDHKEILHTRKEDYYWSVEVPKMVNSGTYALDTMLEKQWVYYNEKGDLVTQTHRFPIKAFGNDIL